MKRYISAAALALWAFASCSPALGGEEWREPACRRRLPLRAPAAAGAPCHAPVLLTGADLYRWTGMPRPETGSLRLHGPGGALPLQVEEYALDGGAPPEPDGRIDDHDRIAFALPLAKEPRTFFLYYDGPADPGAADSGVEILRPEKDLVPLQLQSGNLLVGMRGGGESQDDASGTPVFGNVQANHGRGAVSLFRWKGQALADMRGGWTQYFPVCLGSGPGAPRWSDPRVVHAGPVRTVVEVSCRGVTEEAGGKEILRADITRRLALWAASPVADWEELARYETAVTEYTWNYGHKLPVGAALDAGDRFVVPLAGEPHAVDFAPLWEEIEKNPWRRLYQTALPEEGWLAVQDGREKTGLAVFYERLPSIRRRAAWVTYRPALHPEIYMRAAVQWNCVELRLGFRDRAVRNRDRFRRAFRYVALAGESPAAIRQQYLFWAESPDRAFSVGRPRLRE